MQHPASEDFENGAKLGLQPGFEIAGDNRVADVENRSKKLMFHGRNCLPTRIRSVSKLRISSLRKEMLSIANSDIFPVRVPQSARAQRKPLALFAICFVIEETIECPFCVRCN
jgi:hypothetical protein